MNENSPENRLFTHFRFFSLCSICLVFGLVGLHRAGLRGKPPFQVADNHNCAVITHIYDSVVSHNIGISTGDCVSSVNSIPIANASQFNHQFERYRFGETISFSVTRNNSVRRYSTVLEPYYDPGFLLLSLFLGLTYWVVGVFIGLRKLSDTPALYFAWASMAIGTAILMIWPGYPYGGTFFGYIIPIVHFSLYALAPVFTVSFCLLYPSWNPAVVKKPDILKIITAPGILFSVVLIGTYFVSIGSENPTIQRIHTVVYIPFRIYFIVYLLAGISELLFSIRRSDNKQDRYRITWILLGLFLGSSPFLFLWSLPQAFGFTPLVSETHSAIFLAITPLFFAYSIIRYRVLDIDVVISRGTVYLFLTMIIVLIYLVLVGLIGGFIQGLSPQLGTPWAIICTLFVAILFSPLKKHVRLFVDKAFYRIRYTYRLVIEDFNEALSHCRHADEITSLLLEKVHDAVPVTSGAVITQSQEGEPLVAASMGFTPIETHRLSDSPIFMSDHLKSGATVFLNPDKSRFVEEPIIVSDESLRSAGIEVLIPGIEYDYARNILALGEKRSGLQFSDEDIGLLTHMVQEATDTMERLRLQEMIAIERTARERLAEINRLKSDFIGHVSHELRTPLTSIRWATKNLLDGIPEKPTKAIHDYLTGMYKSSIHLGRMIDNLLEVTRLEAGKMPLKKQQLALGSEVDSCISRLKPIAEQKDMNITSRVHSGIRVFADSDALQTVLGNLIDNAIKYAPPSTNIEIAAILDETDHIVISIKDQGPGIPVEQQKSIFQRFVRVECERTMKEKGIGLGLHIVKELVTMHEGDIRVLNNPDGGCVFSVTFSGSIDNDDSDAQA